MKELVDGQLELLSVEFVREALSPLQQRHCRFDVSYTRGVQHPLGTPTEARGLKLMLEFVALGFGRRQLLQPIFKLCLHIFELLLMPLELGLSLLGAPAILYGFVDRNELS